MSFIAEGWPHHALLETPPAVEMALYTVAESASSFLTGAAFDWLHLSVHGLCLVLSIISAITLAGWVAYALHEMRGSSSSKRHLPAYAPVPQQVQM